MRFSIVIPVYNEANRISKTIQSIRNYVSQRHLDCELVISDDGSTDNTRQVVLRDLMDSHGLHFRILQSPQNKGKGHAVRQGMLDAKGDVILFCDADLSTPIEEWDKLLEALEEGADVAIGSRAHPQSQVQVHQNIFRESMGKAFNLFARALAFRDIHDSQCGFKCFRRDVARRLFLMSKLDGFCFDAEIVYLAQKSGYHVQEIPVIWRNNPESKVQLFLDPARMFWDLCRIRWIHRNHR